jgi:hypothetical protein
METEPMEPTSDGGSSGLLGTKKETTGHWKRAVRLGAFLELAFAATSIIAFVGLASGAMSSKGGIAVAVVLVTIDVIGRWFLSAPNKADTGRSVALSGSLTRAGAIVMALGYFGQLFRLDRHLGLSGTHSFAAICNVMVLVSYIPLFAHLQSVAVLLKDRVLRANFAVLFWISLAIATLAILTAVAGGHAQTSSPASETGAAGVATRPLGYYVLAALLFAWGAWLMARLAHRSRISASWQTESGT